MANTTWVTALGAAVMSGLTIVAALYLLIALLRQGRGKLRVRLLVGMVISDVLLGCIVFSVEVQYLAGTKLQTGSTRCNAAGFILSTILFTQHMWTLSIALATFLLLKFPLSRATTLLDRYSWLAFPFIWGVSVLHAGIWHATIGWSNNGSLCYYATNASGLDRDLVQFIPRAFVFVVIALLYCGLFNFLRRPDTIQLSSQFVTGDRPDSRDHHMQSSKVLRPLAKMGRNNSNGKGAVNPDAPWEALEFVSIGGGHTNSYIPPIQPTLANEFVPNVSTGILLPSRPASPVLMTPVNETKDPIALRAVRTASSSSASTSSPSSHRPSASDTFITPELSYKAEMPGSADSTTQLVTPHTSLPNHTLSPVLSAGSRGESDSLSDSNTKPNIESEEWEPSGQTLKEFFQEYQAPGAQNEDAEGIAIVGEHKPPQLSASAYFNRQASLLMLYFPIAYMVSFSASLIRLVYDMVHRGQASPILSLLSNWFVLSVGLMDAVVYGIAEFVVKKRVRRKMGDHI